MTELGKRIACAAADKIGTRFRLHGRHPKLGLDCVGLVVCAIEASGRKGTLPNGYRLRNSSIEQFVAAARNIGFEEVMGGPLPGDVILAIPGPAQHHLLIAETAGSFIHADAGLGRVVRVTSPLPWPVVGHWRIKPTS